MGAHSSARYGPLPWRAAGALLAGVAPLAVPSGAQCTEGWGTLDLGFDGEVWDLVDYAGSLVAGGRFSSAGGTPALSVALWDGNAWQPLGAGIPGGVRSLAFHQGFLYAGGHELGLQEDPADEAGLPLEQRRP